MPTMYETTDAAGGVGTTYLLPIGGSVQGALTAGDHDFYRISLVAGQTYVFSLVGTGVNNVRDTFLSLYASDGVTLRASKSLFGNEGRDSGLVRDVIQARDVDARATQPYGEDRKEDQAISVGSDG